MCGVVGYIGNKKALPILLDGIKNLEYRGYDSAGFAVAEGNGVVKSKKIVGRVAALEGAIDKNTVVGAMGICHSRWATHGGVTEANAHPHSDCSGKIWLAHNGIIENYKELKRDLENAGHVFKSETDTEVVSHVIEEAQKQNPNALFEDAVRMSLKKLRGTYGLLIFHADNPGKLIAVRNFSQLVIGVGNEEYIAASDASAVLRHTKQIIYLQDGELAVLTPREHHIFDAGNREVAKQSENIDWEIEEIQKGRHPHFMLKEIFEESSALENSLRGRIVIEEGAAKLGGLAEIADDLKKIKRFLIAACGTAHYAARVGEYMLEEYAGIPAEVDIASEFRYRKPMFQEGDAFLAVSQSGETADTFAALKEAKQKGVLTLGIVNVVGSSISRETDAGVYQHIGPEIGVASTKAFVSQVAIFALLTMYLGRSRTMSLVTGRRISEELKKIPSLIDQILKKHRHVEMLAKKYLKNEHFFFLGRKYNFPVALEGALKLKEVSYVHAEGYAAGELKHGPIALIDKSFSSIVIAPLDSVYEKMISNIQEIKARGGPVIAIATEGDEEISQLADDVFYIPKTLEMLMPILSVIPLQLFAYYFGALRGYDVDKPRNLAKSVTVE